MRDRVYQGIIGGLIVVVGVSFYNSYSIQTNEKKETVDKSVNHVGEKRQYKAIDINALYDSQRADTRVNNLKLNTTLTAYEKSMKKTKQMLAQHSSENGVQEDTYLYEAQQEDMTLSQIQTRISQLESQLNTSQTISKSTASQSDTTSPNINTSLSTTDGSNGVIATTSDATLNNTTNPVTTTANTSSPVSTSKETEVVTNTPKNNEQIIAYKDSINDITQMIEQITTNLN